ncbi:unnamed protein product [Leptosia nina]|uniref:Cadherin domain-containing protein n=1 Tax=Leptosia nina TaxID=320188 RepID=A0AAV1IW60_9NEOP
MSALLCLALLVVAPTIQAQAIQDSRCYLMNGGAVESFFISEDTPIGSVIGTLSVNGDPNEESGNISLKLQERGAAVGIAPGTKNITLLRVLDREEKLGPSSVYVNVRCDRRHTADPSFVIPVSIRVWDVNDNAPAWQSAPYRARISELSAVGARVLTAAAHDPDQPGPHATVHYSVLPGPAAVLDADDQNPKFSYEHYVALLPDDALDGTELETSPGPISARDQDEGINAPLVYSSSGPGAERLRVSKDTGRIAATALLFDNLPLTVVIKATQIDNPDRYALATVSVRRRVARGASAAVAELPGPTGTSGTSAISGPSGEGAIRGVKFTRREYSAKLPEDAAVGTLVLTLSTSPQTERPLQFYVSDRAFLEKFAINSAGEVLLRKALDYETTANYFYQVMVTDGPTNDTASLNITVDNVNEWEPRFRYPLYEFRADLSPEEGITGEEGKRDGRAGGLVKVGQLDVYDGDTEDTVTLTLRGLHAPLFYLNAAGELFLRGEAVPALNTSVLHVVATAIDSGTPPRQSSVPVAVHVSGISDARGSTRSASVLATFVVALVLLALAVLALLIYICTVRRRNPKTEVSGPVGAEKISAPTSILPSSSLQSVSAGASTILDSTSSLDIRHEPINAKQPRVGGKSKVAPAPPVLPELNATERTAVSGPGSPSLMSDHIAGAAGRSGVAWPSSTIPARVKKLSWDDNHHSENEAATVTEATNPALAEHMNLTVYF